MLKGILTIVTAKWLISLIGAIVLSLLIWFAGPLIAIGEVRPLESDIARFGTSLVILIAWGLFNLLSLTKAKRANEQLVNDLAQAPAAAPAPDATASAEEVDILKERLHEALATLKKAKLGGASGRQYLYQLPWYILIGPPGSGKTTALVNSGLSFPLADRLGKDAVRGVGGTRNCDWWFTNEAVLIDTAGRYTTQDSHQAVDSAAWAGFLGLLKKSRPRQPINGALVAISLSDLATLSPTERQAHAHAIKKRIHELHEQLGVQFPIYVLFTKADLIAGFVEFFDDLGREEREQVWGMTLPLDDGKSAEGVIAAFDDEFDALVGRLNDRLLERVHEEPDIQRRSLIYGFPAQVASLKQAAQDFLEEIFRPSRFETRPLLRGIYFTSGTQEGTPIDRLMGAMASTFGVDRQRLSAFSGSGRSYFLTRLLRAVMFAEAGVVGTNPRVERLRRWVQRGAFAVAGMLILGLAGLWYNSYASNRLLIAAVNGTIADYDEQIADLDLTQVDDTRLDLILPPLNTLRTIPAGYAGREAGAPLAMTFGLYQGDKLGSQAVVAYRRALNALLLPRLILRLEGQLRGNADRPDYLYEALKVYLMLGGQGPLDAALVRQWMALDWQSIFPGDAGAETRQALAAHLDALLAAPLSEIGLDGDLIDQSRRTLSESPLAERAYTLIVQSSAARRLPAWRIVDHAGPAAARVLARASGRPLSEGVPGLYTYDGFHQLFLPAVADVARAVASESWVLGPQSEIAVEDAELARLEQDVLSLYLDDYAALWDGLLADVVIAPFSSLQHAVEMLNILSGPNSPIRSFLAAAARETTLTAPPKNAAPAGEGAATDPAQTVQTGVDRLASVVVGATGNDGTEAPGKFVDDRFRSLHDLVKGADGAPPPLDSVIAGLNDLYLELNRISAATAQGEALLGAAGGSGNAAQQLQTAAARLPVPLGGWLESVAQGAATLTVGGARAQLNAIWTADVLPLCRRALDNRYPLVKDSTIGVTLDDFSRLFGPNGLIDDFFKTHLSKFVDTSSRPWRWRQVDNVDLGISSAVLAQFQRAAAIRDSFFPAGSSTPSVHFTILPVSLDASATQVLIELEGQTVSYNHGPPRPVEMQWPGTGAAKQVRVAFSPPVAGQMSNLTKDGPWSWFRLLDEASVSGGARGDQFTVTFTVGGRSATFELRASSVMNPFTLKELEAFRCPGSL
ncbi:type VI secretion system membrane subunit TssM [Rhodospirillaceae bacterium SYSU D60014]|uniref:type VI secretion system membrane subunit TssM n=1 Tax=Virgifigura deserti TaxID=2268457 RepID=UPI000E663D8A